MTVDERLVLEGGKVKLLCAERQQKDRSGVIIDYLRLTVRRDALLQVEGITESDDDTLCQALAFRVACETGFVLGEARNGRDYYEFTWTIHNDFGKEVASVSGGGATQRDTFCITLKGEACTFARAEWEARLYAFLAPLDPRVTRIDLARDFLAGEVCIDEVVGHYKGGSFDYRNRRPTYQQHGCWLDTTPVSGCGKQSTGEGDGFPKLYGHARTFQVGQRDSGKLLRAYEKGHQFKIMGDPWLRVEVELRNTNRIIPFDALIRPADFFAGAYDFCQMILDTKPVPERIATGKAVGERTVERFAKNFERQSGPSVKTMFAALGVDVAVELLVNIAARHANRPTPRSLTGISHAKAEEGFQAWFKRYSDTVPASDAPF